MDNLTSAYDKLGLVRERMGTGTAHTVPHNHYPTEDGKWVAIACTSDRIFQRLAKAMGREELAEDPRYQTGPERVKRREEVDGMVSEWTQTFDMNALTELLDSEEVPVSPINSIADIFQNPQYEARGSIVEVDDPVVGRVKMPGVVPRMSQSPGSVDHLALAWGCTTRRYTAGFWGTARRSWRPSRKRGSSDRSGSIQVVEFPLCHPAWWQTGPHRVSLL